jgi:integrase
MRRIMNPSPISRTYVSPSQGVTLETFLVFPTAVGTPEDPNARANREFYFARRQAGLRTTLRLHDLRHYAGSRLIEQGANIMLVSRTAGHAKPSVTLDVYAHLFAEGIEEAAGRFDPLAPGRWEVDGATANRP